MVTSSALLVNWHEAGYPVPRGYQAADAQPPTAEARAYQLVRGDGTQGELDNVLPESLQDSPERAPR